MTPFYILKNKGLKFPYSGVFSYWSESDQEYGERRGGVLIAGQSIGEIRGGVVMKRDIVSCFWSKFEGKG